MSATSFSGSGLRDWLLQRFSAVLIAAYTFFLIAYIGIHSGQLDFALWSALFAHPLMRIATTLVMFAILIHAWIGIWTVLGDYVKPWTTRLLLHTLVITVLWSLLIWGFIIIWSN